MDCVGRRFPASSTGTVFLRQLQLQYGEHCVFVPVLHIVRQLQQEHDVLPALVLPVLHIMREQQLQHGCNVMRQSNQRASRPPPPRTSLRAPAAAAAVTTGSGLRVPVTLVLHSHDWPAPLSPPCSIVPNLAHQLLQR